ncbi:MAG: DUF4115 domain-containing protein [Chloroflexota bacterium]|nr:DUF4115 domain-containing protein [Chloroflexota bacterium]
METLGVWLRQTREAQGDTLQEAEAATCIRARFLEMLEAGDFAAFPGGEVQVRGFLRIYARHLDLSPDEVLARCDAEMHGVEAIAPATAPAETQALPSVHLAREPVTFEPSSISISTSRPRWMNLRTLMVVGSVVILLLVAVTAVRYFVGQSTDERAVATATVPAEAVLPMPTSTLLNPTPAFVADPEGGVALTLEATEHVWVRVLADGQTAFEGLMASGQVESWSDQEVIIVDAGNGAGLLVTVNGQSQGTMCGRGQVCTRAWGSGGEIAVPSLSPTPAP